MEHEPKTKTISNPTKALLATELELVEDDIFQELADESLDTESIEDEDDIFQELAGESD